MGYSPKHAAVRPAPSIPGRRAASAALVSAATVGAGLASAGAAHASTPYNVWDQVAACESSGNWAINSGNGFYGGLQFTASTWRAFGGARFASSAQYASRDQQIYIAQNVLRGQGPGAWPVCSRRAGLTTSNGLAVQVDLSGGGSGSGVGTPPSRGGARTLALDGIFGPLTTRAVQQWVGTTQDGILGPVTSRALQAKLGVVQDGIIGPKTIYALQTRIGISHDGAWQLNYRTVLALQQYLNANVIG